MRKLFLILLLIPNLCFGLNDRIQAEGGDSKVQVVDAGSGQCLLSVDGGGSGKEVEFVSGSFEPVHDAAISLGTGAKRWTTANFSGNVTTAAYMIADVFAGARVQSPRLVGDDINSTIHTNTSDGTDTKAWHFCGGGDGALGAINSPTRGGCVSGYGNENVSYPGDIRIIPGETGTVVTDGKSVLLPSSDTAVVAGTALTVTKTLQRVVGSGGAVIVTATPSIVDGVDGQIVYIQGTDDTNTVEFQDEANLASSGLALAGNVNMVLGKGDMLVLTYDAGDDLWYEISRSAN